MEETTRGRSILDLPHKLLRFRPSNGWIGQKLLIFDWMSHHPDIILPHWSADWWSVKCSRAFHKQDSQGALPINCRVAGSMLPTTCGGLCLRDSIINYVYQPPVGWVNFLLLLVFWRCQCSKIPKCNILQGGKHARRTRSKNWGLTSNWEEARSCHCGPSCI